MYRWMHRQQSVLTYKYLITYGKTHSIANHNYQLKISKQISVAAGFLVVDGNLELKNVTVLGSPQQGAFYLQSGKLILRNISAVNWADYCTQGPRPIHASTRAQVP